MDFNQRKKELLNQANLVKAQLTDAKAQVKNWKARVKEFETQINSTLGAIALCDEAIVAKNEESPIPETATEDEEDDSERYRV